MNLRTILFPLAVAAGLAFAIPDTAQASPLSGHVSPVALGGIHVGGGIGVTIPIGGYYREGRYYHTAHPGGYWVQTGTQTYMVRDHVIGYDVNGVPIWSYREVVQPLYSWVEAPRIVRRVYFRSRPTFRLSLGLGWFFR